MAPALTEPQLGRTGGGGGGGGSSSFRFTPSPLLSASLRGSRYVVTYGMHAPAVSY
jgi:hypothetical protein